MPEPQISTRRRRASIPPWKAELSTNLLQLIWHAVLVAVVVLAGMPHTLRPVRTTPRPHRTKAREPEA